MIEKTIAQRLVEAFGGRDHAALDEVLDEDVTLVDGSTVLFGNAAPLAVLGYEA